MTDYSPYGILGFARAEMEGSSLDGKQTGISTE